MSTTCASFGLRAAQGACSCPPGAGGATCNELACDNALLAPAARRLFSPALAGNGGSAGCGAQCTPGWTGVNCNVCTNDNSCTVLATTSAVGSASNSGGLTSSGGNNEITCSTSQFTYTQGFVSCNVINPTLQAVFAGTTSLTIQKTPLPSFALSSPFGANGTTSTQIWYSPNATAPVVEQFYCGADTCVQTNRTTTIDWVCQNLQCVCRPGTTFCGGGALDLTNTINGLAGEVAISCSTSSTTCNFRQALLVSLFGADGLALSSCSAGECINRSTLANLAAGAGATSSGSNLSPGVIGGLAVLGAFIVGLIGFVAYMVVAQRKARRGGAGRGHYSEKRGGVGISFQDISYTLLPSTHSSFIRRRRSRATAGKQVLEGLSGHFPAGEFSAILGPSGAGKSTILDILAGKRKSGKIGGSIGLLVDSQRDESDVSFGYVDQDTVLPATSTVRECLMFAAELRMGSDAVSRSAKEQRVDEILNSLGLQKIAGSRIGDGERRGISGGERRRLSIGLELLGDPCILFVDEPTSGLDSTSASNVISVLKNLTSASTTVIATIHQPSSRIYAQFDRVLVLGRGREVYAGVADQAGTYFASRGQPCPAGWNIADHLLEIASDAPLISVVSEIPTRSRSDSSKGGLHPTSSLSYRSSPHSSTGPADESDDTFPPSKTQLARASTPRSVDTPRSHAPRMVLLTQIQALSRREIQNLRRDLNLVVMHNAVAVIIGLFVGGIYYQTNSTIGGFQSRLGSLFFLGSLIAFAALSALTNFSAIKTLFLRERAGSYYSPQAWLITRILFDLIPLRILPTILMGTIVYWMVGLAATAENFFKFLLILLEFACVTTLFNLLLAASIRNTGVAILSSAVVALVQMAYAGFFVSIGNIPPVLRWIQYLDPLKYTLEALSVNEVSSGLLIEDVLGGIPVSVSAELIMKTLFGFEPTAYYRDVLALFAFIVGLAVLLTLAVVARLREIK